MLNSVLKSVFGSANDRRLKRYRPKIAAINALEREFEALSDDELRAKTDEFRAEIAAGATLDDLAPRAFAAVREAAKRTLKQRHFDVQLVGGYVLHEGAIAEMRTGEGKTLVATLAVYLNALNGKGVHVVTVNDYLARRDAEWMGQIYKFLGMSVGVIVHGLDDDERRAAYACRHHLRHQQRVRLRLSARQHEIRHVADGAARPRVCDRRRSRTRFWSTRRARRSSFPARRKTAPASTPPSTRSSRAWCAKTTRWTRSSAPSISPTPATSTPKTLLREIGVMKESSLSLYEAANATIVHHVNQALRAHKLFQRDKDYIVRNGEVVIVDEFTGRMMPGRRYSEGLHQALEAKEHVNVQPENVTLASITFQNYFRLYKKLAGMTGTAATEADEFLEIYKLVVVEIPTNVRGGAKRRGRRGLSHRRREAEGGGARNRSGERGVAADAGRHHVDREVGAARRPADRVWLQAHRLLPIRRR